MSEALPPVVDADTWRRELDELRTREKAATRELDAIAAQRRRMPMVEVADHTLTGPDGPIALSDIFDGRSQLIVYNHMWTDGATFQCGGCTGYTSQFTRLDFLDNYDARFVIVTNGPIDEALNYKRRVGNQMDWYSAAGTTFGTEVDAAPGEGFAVNVFLRDGQRVFRTWHTPVAAPSNSVIASRSSTSCRGAGRRSGRTCPTAGRNARRTRGGPVRPISRASTARRRRKLRPLGARARGGCV